MAQLSHSPPSSKRKKMNHSGYHAVKSDFFKYLGSTKIYSKLAYEIIFDLFCVLARKKLGPQIIFQKSDKIIIMIVIPGANINFRVRWN